jgi:hypothetical protein
LLLVGFALVMVSTGPEGQAQTTSGSPVTPAGGSGGTANASVIQSLQSVKMILEKADHDYQGHRAKAVMEVSAATRALEHHAAANNAANPNQPGGSVRPGISTNGQQPKTSPKQNPTGNAGSSSAQTPKTPTGQNSSGTTPKEPQPESDNQLRQALQQLKAIEGQLKGEQGGGRARAAACVQKAIQELDAALTVR